MFDRFYWGEGGEVYGCGTYDVAEIYMQGFGTTTQGRRPHGRSLLIQEDNINIDLIEIK